MGPLSDVDQDFLGGVTLSDLQAFRNYTVSPRELAENPFKFLDNNWINIPQLKDFLAARVTDAKRVIIKEEQKENLNARCAVKVEQVADLSSVLARPSRPDRVVIEDGHEVTVLSSDDEASDDDDQQAKDKGNAMTAGPDEILWIESDTQWEDDGLVSQVCITADTESSFRITKEVRVERLERLKSVPSFWPVLKTSTAFILDLSESEFDWRDSNDQPMSMDRVMKNKDNDSWKGSTGVSDSKVQVTFEPGTDPITCRRARLECRGHWVCERVAEDVYQAERRELDPAQRQAILAKRVESRTADGSTKESQTVIFFNLMATKMCPAVDDQGKRCIGKQFMKEAKDKDGKLRYFMACDGWRKDFTRGHLTHSIYPPVDPTLLARMYSGESIHEGTEKDTPPCVHMNSCRVGKKQEYCPMTHIVTGVGLKNVLMLHKDCPCRRTVYVPTNSRIRKIILIHPGNIAHNHPMPPLQKTSVEDKSFYGDLVEAAGVLGATPMRVDNASSTEHLLAGRTPAEIKPSLQNSRMKREIVRTKKTKRYPHGTGLEGVTHMLRQDIDNNVPLGSRYIHRVATSLEGRTLILTADPQLLALIHDVTSFEGDTTFKRTVGDFDEWEMVIFYKPVQRAITIARIYMNGHDTATFKYMFDLLQELVEALTGRPLCFKRLSQGGNLLAMNADMEIAAIIGAGLSFLPTNDPSYSGIHTVEASELVQYFLKLCLVHFKRGILDFRGQLAHSDFQQLMNVPQIKTLEELDAFDHFIVQLQNKKVTDWWEHKKMHKWILPCVIRSLSKIKPDDWDATPNDTNIGEGQHHWTNQQTGTRLSLLESIETARKADTKVATSIQLTRRTGILQNQHNETTHRANRKIQRKSAAMRNSMESSERDAEAAKIQQQIEDEKRARKESTARQKELAAKLKQSKSSGPTKSRKKNGESSSSGRVKSLHKSASAQVTVNAIEDVIELSDDGEEVPGLSDEEFGADASGFDPWGFDTQSGSMSSSLPYSHSEPDDYTSTRALDWEDPPLSSYPSSSFASDDEYNNSASVWTPDDGLDFDTFGVGDSDISSVNERWGLDASGLPSSSPLRLSAQALAVHEASIALPVPSPSSSQSSTESHKRTSNWVGVHDSLRKRRRAD